jgi:hypothetical protein
MDISRRHLVALHAGGLALPPDRGQAELGFTDPYRLQFRIYRLHG